MSHVPSRKKDFIESQLGEASQVPGYCSPEKMRCLNDLAYREAPLISVEVGVYGGRSLLVIAIALRELGKGLYLG